MNPAVVRARDPDGFALAAAALGDLRAIGGPRIERSERVPQ